MKKLPLFFSFVVVSVGAGLQAQQATPGPVAPGTPGPALVLPPGPPLKPFPDNIRWTLTTTGKQADVAPPGASPVAGTDTGKPGEKEKPKGPASAIVGERMGKMAHQLTVRSGSGREEKWTDGTLVATSTSGTDETMYSTGSIEKAPVPSWVSQSNLVDIKKQGEKSFFVFRSRILPTGLEIVQDMEAKAHGKGTDTESLKVDATAVIDGETRLPVAVKEGDATTTYKFEPLAPDFQIIPATLQAAFAEREKKMRDSVRKVVHP